jgi:hypothetical protein
LKQADPSATFDLWSSCRVEGFIGLTGHWIDDNWRLREACLGMAKMEGEHTGERVFAAVENILTSYNIQDRMFSATADGASNAQGQPEH